MMVLQQKSVLTWVIALGVLTLFIAGSSSGSMGSPDKNRDGCKINHRLPSGISGDTLPTITRQQLAGTWLYRSIDTFHLGLGNRPGGIYTAAKLVEGKLVPLALTSNDTLRIAENGPFFYAIVAIGKKAWGRARVEGCSLPFCRTGYQLALYYDQGSTTPEPIRNFRIQHFSGDSLVIQEGNTYFRYSRWK
ncbi:MAG: hypothetical protein ACKO67_06235 [Bacteroidota bacterium]